jgi:hypothetical protein
VHIVLSMYFFCNLIVLLSFPVCAIHVEY